MKRTSVNYAIPEGEYDYIKEKMLYWSKQYSIFLFLNSNNYSDKHSRYDFMVAAGAADIIRGSEEGALAELQQFHDENGDWLFGNICYDYKNALEPRLSSAKEGKTGWPLLYFFRPEVVCHVNTNKDRLTIESLGQHPDVIYHAIMAIEVPAPITSAAINFTAKVDRNTYLQKIERLRQHIKDGDCYEINYCTEGFVKDVQIEPYDIYRRLNKLSPSPFSAFYRNEERYMMCASMERYLRKEGSDIISQPIKGTARRGADAVQDEEIKAALAESIKDRAENVMIVDLVRNDLARCCKTGSIRVDELCKIYTFPQVHQMISTIGGELKESMSFTDAIRFTFPMGSMTGAPKVKVMELIEVYEDTKRELYSGTVGYITPVGDFDFNVVIRSMFYNAATQYLSYETGGAITYDSKAEEEWDEMRLKAWAMERVLAGTA